MTNQRNDLTFCSGSIEAICLKWYNINIYLSKKHSISPTFFGHKSSFDLKVLKFVQYKNLNFLKYFICFEIMMYWILFFDIFYNFQCFMRYCICWIIDIFVLLFYIDINCMFHYNFKYDYLTSKLLYTIDYHKKLKIKMD